MRDTLERERLPDNFLDRMFSLEERVRRLEELLVRVVEAQAVVIEPATGKRFVLEVVEFEEPRGKMLKAREVGRSVTTMVQGSQA